ncbi:MAG: hypothetical protein IT370_14845 [Deltaproteobacteria bacterium]|nr:hypothetical protein [Deltaproteobacteria bacterium]
MRRDLPLGMIAAQLIHAAGESSPGGLASGTRAVALMVEDEAALRALAQSLVRWGVPHVQIREPDPPWSGAENPEQDNAEPRSAGSSSLMAIGVVPMAPRDRKQLRRLLGGLPLLR